MSDVDPEARRAFKFYLPDGRLVNELKLNDMKASTLHKMKGVFGVKEEAVRKFKIALGEWHC